MPTEANRTAAANHLQSDWGGCSVSFIGWPGTTAAVAKDKKQIMADSVGAKKIGASVPKFDTKAPTYKALTKIKGQIRDLWEAYTLDWVEDGIRLIRQDTVAAFNDRLLPLTAELDAARSAFAACYPDLMEQAREDNGDLFDRSVYISDFDGQYSYKVDYPSLSAPAWLKDFSPNLYAEQSAKIAARFDAAVGMAEDAFAAELADMIGTLQRKLQGLDDGTEKRLHDTAITNLLDFFDRFRSLNLHSSQELDRVFEMAEDVISRKNLLGGKPITKDELKDSPSLRADIRTRLSAVGATLEGMTTAKPRRAINRRAKPRLAINRRAKPEAAESSDTPAE
jgi:predicted kinase